MATAEETYGVDIAFKGDFVKTASGDLDTSAGLDNLKDSILRRLFTTPGAVIHRPTYGVGLGSYVNSLNSIGIQRKLANLIQEQLEQDPRIESFIGLRVESPDDNDSMVKILVRVKPVGYDEQTLTITTGGV